MILQLIDVLIGLVIIYMIFSSIASALMELVEVMLQKKGQLLEQGIRELLARSGPAARALSQEELSKVVQRFYESAPIFSLFRGDYQAQGRNLPSYIPAQRFAQALVTGAQAGEAPLAELLNLVRSQLPAAAANEVAALQSQVEAYFNESMERVAGWYRRFARWWLLAISLGLALLANVDTLAIVKTLSLNDDLREQLVQQATINADNLAPAATDEAAADEALTIKGQLDHQLALVETLGLPVGWTQTEGCAVLGLGCDAASGWEGAAALAKLLGCVLTALALSFGAPFWFDLLNQLVNLRSTIKPKEAEDDETPSAAKPVVTTTTGT